MSVRQKPTSKLSTRLAQGVFYRTAHRLFREHLTESGRSMFWIVVVSTTLSLFSFVIKAYLLWSGLIAVCAISILGSRWARANIDIEVEAPERGRAGQSFRIGFKVFNRSKRKARDLRVRYQSTRDLKGEGDGPFLDLLGPGSSYHFSQDFHSPRRGVYELSVLLQETCFPFGLWCDLKFHKRPLNLIVYPNFHPIHTLDIPVGMRYQPGGLALSSYLGDSTEFLSTREFRSGDPLRTIHWRSWARLGKPIVKEHGEEFFCRLALIVDTLLPPQANEETLEKAISLAAAITDYLARQEYVIDLFAAGSMLYQLQAGRSLAYLENILDLLACLESCPTPENDPFLEMESSLMQELDNISTVLLVLTTWDEKRGHLLELLSVRGVAVRAFLVTFEELDWGELPRTVTVIPAESIKAGGVDAL